MSENVIQTSFASGELAPSLYARVDLAKYHAGAARMRNFFVDYRSGASSRPGLKYVIPVLQPSTPVRLIPYQLSSLTTFAIEFGDHYCRFITNNGPVLEASIAITAITNSSPAQVTVPGHIYAVNDWIFTSGVVGMNEINNQYYVITGIGGNVLTISYPDGSPVNSVPFGIYSSGGTTGRVYKISSPYAAADLALLKFSQISSSMTIVHPSYPPYSLVATTPTNWTFTPIVFGTTVTAPGGLGFAISAAGTANYSYVVTSIDAQGQESIASTPLAVPNAVNIGTTAGTITVTWVASAGAVSYNIYKAELAIGSAVPSGAAYGFVGTSTGVAFVDSNIVPDFATTPPLVNNPFAGGNNPGCTCFFQQRAYYAASTAQPTTFWASQPGFYNNFNESDPIQADDSIEGTLVSLQVNAIKSMVPMPGGLILLTSTGAWQLSSGTGVASTSAVTPINAIANPQAYNGASDVPPLPINFDILFVQDKGSIVRALSYNLYANIYTSTDISVLSNHLFYNFQLNEWAYAEEPFKSIWVVRDDGTLLALTYVKEQEIYGWSRHDTLGLFKSIVSIREGQTDAIYVVVKRQLNGQWTQIIERMADRTFPYGAEDAFCVDCGAQSAPHYPSANLTASSSTGAVIFSADAGVFVPGDVGSILRMGGGIATITQFVAANQIVGTWTQDPTVLLPNDINEIPLPADNGDWSLTAQFSTFTGLQYLEGQTVSILADGGVVPPQVVSGGQITLPAPASKVTVGLAFTPQLQTMYLDTGDPTIQGKRKKINALTVRATDARGLLAGRTFDTLVPIKQLTALVPIGSPIPLQLGDQRVVMDPLWDVPGQICLQIDDPLPATVLGVIPEITIGDTVR